MANKQFCNFIYSGCRVSQTGYANFSKSRGRGDLYILFIVSDRNFGQCIFSFDFEFLEFSSHVETLSLTV